MQAKLLDWIKTRMLECKLRGERRLHTSHTLYRIKVARLTWSASHSPRRGVFAMNDVTLPSLQLNGEREL